MKSGDDDPDLLNNGIDQATSWRSRRTPDDLSEHVSQTSRRVSRNPEDIVCGRGLHIMCHNGNEKLHLIVNRHRNTYHSTTRREKAAIANQIVEDIKRSGSRFIRRVEDGRDDEWEEVDDVTAYKKVGHALRLRKNFQPKNNAASGRGAHLSQSNQGEVGGSSCPVASGTLNGAAAPPSAISQHQIAHNGPSMAMPHVVLPASWPMLGGFHQRQRTLAQPMPPPLPNNPLVAASIANQYRQLLAMNQLLASLVGPALAATLVHASIQQQHSSQPLQGEHTVQNGGVQSGGAGPDQETLSTSDDTIG